MGGQRWGDAALTAALLIAELAIGYLTSFDHPLDAVGTALLIAATLPLLLRRRYPLAVLIAHGAVAMPYHFNDFQHEAIVPATMVALYTVARHGTRLRTAIVVTVVVVLGVCGIALSPTDDESTSIAAFGAIGWIVLACVAGEAVRLQRAYIAEVLDRAERAERSRDEEARRQVAEERLRIARDLHDLLAHTITVIQVQAGVAAHLLDTETAGDDTVRDALDTISAACADARTELSATVGVLRAPGGAAREPLPTLARLKPLAEPAEAAGATVEFGSEGEVRPLSPAVEMVGYRIIQEALTNTAKHAAATRVQVHLRYRPDYLVVRIADNGRGANGGATGFGIRGMCERAAAVGGNLTARSTGNGFEVVARLPLDGRPGAATTGRSGEIPAVHPNPKAVGT
ncbi:sensor histidine kinase [Nocardia yamanashiensis]|uniref:sensor histidine kinase n=1 Tax=Nocardia yamanashiensis TaxID=209247 RepID=UPI00083305F8|nr:sensor histidine kinase [Nocardia yamanashiensis]